MTHINNNFYCVKCKRKTETRDLLNVRSKNDRPMLRGICTECCTTKTQFVKETKGGDLVGSLNSVTKNIKLPWARFPGELHLPGHSFTGPGTRLDLRLNPDGAPKTFSKPVDRVDSAALRHDLAYAQYPDTASRNVADREMVDELNKIPNPTFRERVERAIVKPILATKANLGLGLASSDSKSDLKVKWTDQLAEELHKPVVKNFRKRRVYVKGIDEIWAADLIDMQSFAEYNDGFKYLLSVVDIFSKYGWIVPLKDKSGKSVSQAFEKIFTSSERKPKKLWVDKGKEFYNKDVQKLVELYSTENEEKSCIIERWNRTMREKMFKYFTANSTRRYIDVLDSIVARYNDTRHSSIKMSPKEASMKKNKTIVWTNLNSINNLNSEPIKPKFSVSDKVRITKKKTTFEKGYTPRWTEEVFTVTQVQYTDPPTYKISDYNGEEIQGTFYEQELQKTTQEIYRIEKIIRKRGKKSLVKWLGYPESFNSWVDNETLMTL